MSELNPYEAPATAVGVDEEPSELLLAGRGTRLAAAIIDGVIGFATVFPAYLATGYARINGYSVSTPPNSWSLLLQVFAVGLAVFALVQGFPLASTGQTWGKKALSIRIVDLDGAKPGFLRLLFLRYGVGRFFGAIPYIGQLYWLTDVLFIFDTDRRCVHDMIADTKVVMVAN